MKIRKLILKSKLQQIEKQYQYVFIFHCSGLTNLQWRQLKELLSNNEAKTFFQPNCGKKSVNSLKHEPHRNRGSTKKSLSLLAKPENELDLLNSRLSFLSGPYCIFYLKSHRKTEKTQGSSQCDRSGDSLLNWSEMVKKIESLEFKTKLILLYGRMESTIVNHVDIKQASSLETRELYQQLLWSAQSPFFSLDFCLHQKKWSIPSLLDKHKSTTCDPHEPSL